MNGIFPDTDQFVVFLQLNVSLYCSLISEVSHDEAKMRERGETPLSFIFASS